MLGAAVAGAGAVSAGTPTARAAVRAVELAISTSGERERENILKS